MPSRIRISAPSPHANEARQVEQLARALASERYSRLASGAGEFMLQAARAERRHLIKPAASLVAAAERCDAAGSVKALVYLARQLDRAA